MNIMRQPEFVEAFHYNMNTPESGGETEIRVEINPLDMSEQADFDHENSSVLGLRVVFNLVFDEFKLSGAVRQLVTSTDRKIATAEELSQEELDELMRPLFSIVERLSYEVTEIALDRPGVQLNFSNHPSAEPTETEVEAD